MRRAVLLAVAVAGLGLVACGGDDGGSSGGDAAQAPATQERTSDGGAGEGQGGSGSGEGTGGDAGSGAKEGGGRRSGAGGESGNAGDDGTPAPDLDDKAPAPKVGGKDRGKSPDVGGPPKSEGDFTGIARQIFEASRYFCRQAGVEGMRKEYDIKSADPEDIAREAARRNQPRGYPEAVYSGCLEGLRKS